MSQRSVFFATCAPGLEPMLHAEIKTLKVARVERQVGGVRFEGGMLDAWRANLWLRTAVRILWRLEQFEALDDDALYAAVRKIDWTRFVGPEGSICVSAQTRDSLLDHSRFIEQRTKDAIVDDLRDRTGARPNVDRDSADLNIHIHVFNNRVTLSIDTSGASLHKRGWRRYQGRAPLAETLAAGILQLSGWDQRSPLVDPFCGSGTFLVEAALAACGRAPGSFRRFAFERLPDHDAATYAKLHESALAAGEPRRKLRLLGMDADPERLTGAAENLEFAGVGDMIELEEADARDFAPRPGWNAWIVTNPPYGERVGAARQLVPIYRDFGQRLREHCSGYHLALFSGNTDLASELALHDATSTQLKNGALDCELLCRDL
jgi:putative N6-adenine-specific DNA methylase